MSFVGTNNKCWNLLEYKKRLHLQVGTLFMFHRAFNLPKESKSNDSQLINTQ